jgi:O-antigen ligase
MNEAHNEYFNALFELGYPGLILVGCFLVSMVLLAFWLGASLPVLPACGLATLLVGCFGFSVMHYAPPALVGCAWLGMWNGGRNGETEKRRNGVEKR